MTGLLDQRFGLKRALLLGVVLACALATSQVRAAAQSFAALSEQLSEPNGDFDTDNLISNERGYLTVIPTLVSGGVTGGAYVGVGAFVALLVACTVGGPESVGAIFVAAARQHSPAGIG